MSCKEYNLIKVYNKLDSKFIIIDDIVLQFPWLYSHVVSLYQKSVCKVYRTCLPGFNTQSPIKKYKIANTNVYIYRITMGSKTHNYFKQDLIQSHSRWENLFEICKYSAFKYIWQNRHKVEIIKNHSLLIYVIVEIFFHWNVVSFRM